MNTNKQKFMIGQKVDASKWDKTLPRGSKQRIGICTISNIFAQTGCESGYMISVVSEDGRVERLDQNWLVPVEELQQVART